MTLRERIEAEERTLLAPGATLAADSLGREREEAPDEVRTCFMRDRDRIIHSKSFRRLKHKTQVFLSPEGDHYRTRLTHTLEVAQISRTVARALRLNEDLAEAIALGHDLGHTPFGHAGERALSEALGKPFNHNEQSLRVVRLLEKEGKGLNLTREVLDGILCHTGPRRPTPGRAASSALPTASLISITTSMTPSGRACCRKTTFPLTSSWRWVPPTAAASPPWSMP